MSAITKLLDQMRSNPSGIRFSDAVKVATKYFGKPRTNGSHHIFSTPWPGDPRVNLQNTKDGKAKRPQVEQLISAIDKVEADKGK